MAVMALQVKERQGQPATRQELGTGKEYSSVGFRGNRPCDCKICYFCYSDPRKGTQRPVSMNSMSSFSFWTLL